MQGWIKIHRQITENFLWQDKPFREGQAFIDLLLITTFDKGFVKIKNGERIELQRGECGYSMETLANRWGWSRGKVKRFLNLLENEKMIQQKKVSNFTIINILNFDIFQNDTTNDTTNGQQMIQQTDTIKNVKNDKNVKNVEEEEEEVKEEEEIERAKKACDFYGEYSNVFLSKKNHDKLEAEILNNTVMQEIIQELSEKIVTNPERYKRYDETNPDNHFALLRGFWRYRKEHPEKFKKELDGGRPRYDPTKLPKYNPNL